MSKFQDNLSLAIEFINRADDAGAGGKQRDLVEQAITVLARHYADSMYDAGNDAAASLANLTEFVKVGVDLSEAPAQLEAASDAPTCPNCGIERPAGTSDPAKFHICVAKYAENAETRLSDELFSCSKQATGASEIMALEANRGETRRGHWEFCRPRRDAGGWRGRIVFWSPVD